LLNLCREQHQALHNLGANVIGMPNGLEIIEVDWPPTCREHTGLAGTGGEPGMCAVEVGRQLQEDTVTVRDGLMVAAGTVGLVR
jgi:hypothetical protein